MALADLADVPLCLAEPRRYFRRYLDGHFRELGVTPKVKVESASVMQLMQSVFLGLGCAVLPQGSLLPEMTPALRFRSLILPPMQRQAALVVAPVGKVTALAQNFLVFAQTWLAENTD
ncbi:MAG: LysR family transcriptional regulator substrate-binding protein [Symbiopectobacterium sp.]|uniref:LysR family transcriptional regulator substrate-binding protein n=1 Tax=Symbiopectobacterium sp. TaxID=2952789 RepID=UPI003F377E69